MDTRVKPAYDGPGGLRASDFPLDIRLYFSYKPNYLARIKDAGR
jgi:hypothetical protein